MNSVGPQETNDDQDQPPITQEPKSENPPASESGGLPIGNVQYFLTHFEVVLDTTNTNFTSQKKIVKLCSYLFKCHR